MGPGSWMIPEAVMAALYHWLVMVPCAVQTAAHGVPDLPVDVILMNVRRILDRDNRDVNWRRGGDQSVFSATSGKRRLEEATR
jgi:hypothetical protein